MGSLVEAVLLVVAVAACAVASLGVLVMPSTYARLHYVGLVAAVAAPACAVAVAVAEGIWPAGAKALLIAIVMIASGPIVTHATARAARARHENGGAGSGT